MLRGGCKRLVTKEESIEIVQTMSENENGWGEWESNTRGLSELEMIGFGDWLDLGCERLSKSKVSSLGDWMEDVIFD